MTLVTEYESVILDIIRKLKVKKHQVDDMKQECYMILLEKQEELDNPNVRSKPDLAAKICRNRIIDIYRAENTIKNWIPTDSLSVPRIHNKASKIAISEVGITEEQLNDAVRVLPFDEYQVIYNRYIEGRTLDETVLDLGISKKVVRNREKRGIMALKKFFEV